MARRWTSPPAPVIDVLRRHELLEPLLALRRRARDRRDRAVAGVRRRSYVAKVGPTTTGRRLVRSDDVWMVADEVESFVARARMTEHLVAVVDALEHHDIPYFWCPSRVNTQFHVGVPMSCRADVWLALAAAGLGEAWYVAPIGLPPRQLVPFAAAGDALRRRAMHTTSWCVYRAVCSPTGAGLRIGDATTIEFWRTPGRTLTDVAMAETPTAAEVEPAPAPLVPGAPVEELVTDSTGEVELADADSAILERHSTVLRAPQRNPVLTEIAAEELGTDAVYVGGRPISTTRLFRQYHDTKEPAFPIDVVYTWVDGGDPVWIARREAAMGILSDGAAAAAAAADPRHNEDGFSATRYTNRDELKYSLRSLHAFADFVNHVFLVTDDQVPVWLDESAPGLTIVDHKEIFGPADTLPTFNSHAIESRLHRIDGISEHYLYLNDDVLFGRRVTGATFFWPSGQPKFFLSRAVIPSGPPLIGEPSVSSAAKNGRDLLVDAVGYLPLHKFRHTPHAQRRSLMVELEERFPDVFERVGKSRFRSVEDFSLAASLHHHYGFATGRAMPGSIAYQYVNLAADNLPDRLRGLASGRYDTWCLNDADVPDERRPEVEQVVADWLESALPYPSRFER